MRKLPLILLGFIFSSLASFSQDAAGEDKFRFGLHFSPNIGWEKPTNVQIAKNGSKIGFGFGLMAEFNLSSRYAVLTGVNINKVNHSSVSSFTTPNLVTDVSIQYLEVPVALKLKTNEIGYFTYFGKFGLAPSYNIKAKYTSNDGTSGTFDSATQPVRLALLVGLGTEYNISGSTRLVIGVDFNNGFTNVYTQKAKTDANGNKRSSINNFIVLNLGVYF